MSAATPTVPTVPIPEVCYITDLLDKALAIPTTSAVRTPLCDALRSVLVDYIARSAISVFMEDNTKYVAEEVLVEKKSA